MIKRFILPGPEGFMNSCQCQETRPSSFELAGGATFSLPIKSSWIIHHFFQGMQLLEINEGLLKKLIDGPVIAEG